MSPTIRGVKKLVSKGKAKLLSAPNLEKHLNSAAARQLQGEEAFFQGDTTDTGGSIDIQESIDKVDEDSSVLELATPKASAKRIPSKSKTASAQHPAQSTPKAPSRKCTVDQTFLSPTPTSNKARRSQPSEQETTGQHAQQLSALIALVNTQNQEILSLKNMVQAQSKEILDIKKLVKKLSANAKAKAATLPTAESMASHLGSLYASKFTLPNPDSNNLVSNSQKPMRNGPRVTVDLSQCNPGSLQKSFSQIHSLLQAFIESNPGTENIKVVGMNKDARREHYYHLIFQTKEEETSARIHDQWIKSHFSQARMQSHTSYPVKVNRA
ncbi:hypothetical protein MMC31_007094 [Peltigera leucophlebia]|nr:hypothetical protein [Peltigera leucophlebia]